jgi:hypothetical protein
MFSLPVAVLLGVGIHVDWHLARHHGRLSAAWPWHWTMALPLFTLGAWYVVRRWPGTTTRVSVGTIAAAMIIGQVLEPIGEYVFFGWPFSESFGVERLRAFMWFTLVGIIGYVVTVPLVKRLGRPGEALPPS